MCKCETKIVHMIIMQHQTDMLQIEVFKHFTGGWHDTQEPGYKLRTHYTMA